MQSRITSRDNERVKQALRLAGAASARAEEGLFFAEGARLCLDLAGRLPPQTVFATQRALDAWPELEGFGGECFLVSDGVAQKLANTKSPQGVFALFTLPRPQLAQMDLGTGVLLCEALQDPANVGAVVRSAAGLGLGGVVLGPGCADPYGPKALRASMGAVAHIPVVAAPLQRAGEYLRGRGVRLYAAALEGSAALAATRARRPFGLLVGNEGAGLTEEALALADERVCIPMQNGVESLNVAAAAAILMYHMTL